MTKFKIKKFCNQPDNKRWEFGSTEYDTYDSAMLACYQHASVEASSLTETLREVWYEVNFDFEVTEAYDCDELEGIVCFPVAVVHYDHAPWDRENDCDMRIISGYIVYSVQKVYSAQKGEYYG